MFLTSSGPAGGRRTWSEVLDLPGTGPVVLHNNTKRETSFGELGYASSSVVQAGSVPESHPLLLQCSLLLLLGVPFCALRGVQPASLHLQCHLESGASGRSRLEMSGSMVVSGHSLTSDRGD